MNVNRERHVIKVVAQWSGAEAEPLIMVLHLRVEAHSSS